MKKYYNKIFRNIIYFLCFFISIGYSAISTNLKISGDVAFMKAAEIRVIGASLNGVTNSGAQTTAVFFDYTSISGGISLPNLNSTVTITVNTKNYVALDKEITSITNTTFSNSDIEYVINGYRLGDKILGNETNTFTITFKYKDTVTTVPSTKTLNYKLTFNFNNYTLNMMIGNTSTSQFGYNWLNGPINSFNIERLEFVTNNTVPNNALGSWDVSTKQNGGIMAWYFDGDANNLYEVVIGSEDGSILASDIQNFLYYLTKLYLFDGNNLDISRCMSIASFFAGVGRDVETLTIRNISSWNTSNVTDMSSMFDQTGRYANIVNIDNIGNWDTSSVTDMSGIFSLAGYSATEWNVGFISSWNTSSVTDMSWMFNYTGYSTTTWNIGDLSSWNTSKVTNMERMFSYAGYSATTWNIGDLSGWNTSSVTTMVSMFDTAGYSASSFYIGNIGSWNISNVKKLSNMLNSSGHEATSWNVGDLSNWNTSEVTYMSSMFQSAGYWATTWSVGDLSNWNTSKVTDMSSMFQSAGYGATTWSVGDLSNWNTSKVTDMSSMFHSAGYGTTTWSVGDLSNWNTSSVEDMSNMFNSAAYSSSSFNIGNIGNWDTTNVSNMSSMFASSGFNSTTWYIGDLSNWNTINVKNMAWMFYCVGEYTTNLTSIGTLNVYATFISRIFYYSKSIKVTLNIYNNPTSYSNAFYVAAVNSGSLITVNYTNDVTDIDNIIATKTSSSNVVKGSLIVT